MRMSYNVVGNRQLTALLIRYACRVDVSPTDVSPTKSSWMLRPLYDLSLGIIIPDQCVPPWRASGEANSLRQGRLVDVWPASSTPLTRFYQFVPLHQVQALPTHYNSESYRFAPLGDTSMSLRSKYLGMGWFGQGHNIQGTLCPRGTTSKNFRWGTHWSGTR